MVKFRFRRLIIDSMFGEELKGKRKRRTRVEITKEIFENYVELSFNVDNIYNNMVFFVCVNVFVDVVFS